MSRGHLSEDEMIDVLVEDVAPELAPELEEHLLACPECTKKLEGLLEAGAEFPRERWEQDREAFIRDLRQKLFGGER